MPELPEVETIARDLRGLVAGARILDARSDWPATLRSHPAEAFRDAIVGREIEGIGRRGKQLLIWLGAGEEAAGGPGSGAGAAQAPAAADPVVATVHLKMTGQLFVVTAETPQDKHVHLVLVFSDGRELRFRDIRKFGRIGLYRRDLATGLPLEGEAAGVLATGVEPLSDEFTAALFVRMLSRRRGRLKTLLLNQDFLAGVGNIYADESLWRARLHPLQDAHTVKPEGTRRLHQALRDVLAEAVERRGSSVDDYTAPEGDGSMQEHLAVYQRAGEPCLRCGRPIARIVVGGRATHFCSWCQRLPAGQRAAAAQATDRAASAQSRTAPTPAATRRGPRWTELDGEGALGRTVDEEGTAADRAAQRASRVVATRKAAASRRAAARSGGLA
jgi:formamidopyrimidine-DNA glycosylase